jgi:hypothetical protein
MLFFVQQNGGQPPRKFLQQPIELRVPLGTSEVRQMQR